MMKTLLLFLFLSPVFANFQVEIAKGEVRHNDKVIKKGDKFEEDGIITVGKSSFCKIKYIETNSVLVVGPDSALKLTPPQKGRSKPNLVKGVIRFVSGGKKDIKEPIFYTKSVAAGIRGTDFLYKSNPLLGETEIVMFDGLVRMVNLDNKKDVLNVKKGQWGGLGGRFGSKFQKPIDLPRNVINHFDELLPLN